MQKYQGDDIAFYIEMFTDDTESVPINLEAKDEVIIYAYTDGCIKSKHSKTVKPDYRLLEKVTSFEYAGIIPSDLTKLMAEGQIILELCITTGSINEVKVFTSGITLAKSTIKIEA